MFSDDKTTIEATDSYSNTHLTIGDDFPFPGSPSLYPYLSSPPPLFPEAEIPTETNIFDPPSRSSVSSDISFSIDTFESSFSDVPLPPEYAHLFMPVNDASEQKGLARVSPQLIEPSLTTSPLPFARFPSFRSDTLELELSDAFLGNFTNNVNDSSSSSTDSDTSSESSTSSEEAEVEVDLDLTLEVEPNPTKKPALMKASSQATMPPVSPIGFKNRVFARENPQHRIGSPVPQNYNPLPDDKIIADSTFRSKRYMAGQLGDSLVYANGPNRGRLVPENALDIIREVEAGRTFLPLREEHRTRYKKPQKARQPKRLSSGVQTQQKPK